MDDRERLARGLAARRAVLGHAHVDQALQRKTELTEEFQDLITRYAWGEIWTRPGLDQRSRRLIVLATLIALGRWEEFQMHAIAAIQDGGMTLEELKEIVLQQAIYCGVPAAHRALEVLATRPEALNRPRDS
jgi:4-carboxymuconolactone decarboxylase